MTGDRFRRFDPAATRKEQAEITFGSPESPYKSRQNSKTIFRGDSDEKYVGVEDCAACGRMEDLTYANSEVIKIINEHFVAIEVDAETRPDIGERYSTWAWPATIFLAPDDAAVTDAMQNAWTGLAGDPICSKMQARSALNLDAFSRIQIKN
jgi:hypothetical protein